MKEIRLRKPAHKLYYRKRFIRITSHEQVLARKLKKGIAIFLVMSEKTDDEEDFLHLMVAKYLSIVIEPQYFLEARPSLRRTITSFTPSECYIYFRFTKADLRHLYQCLKFPENVLLDNRSRMTGEEIFLRGLYELVSGDNQEKISAHVFGAHGSDQSRAFCYFLNYVFDRFSHLVQNNLHWWYRNGFFERSYNAICTKMNVESVNHAMVSHFIDCNCLPTSVVGGGPAESGANAARWNDNLQRTFYNGWKSIHGLKHQTVDNAYGFTVDISGPASLRRNDLVLLRESDINKRMSELQTNNERQYIIFGDSAYRTQSHIRSYFHGPMVNNSTRKWNNALKSVRISIEWNYGFQATLFRYLLNQNKLKILKTQNVAKVYTVTCLFRNFYIAVYGSQSSNYFDLHLPSTMLDCYINQSDIEL